MDKFTFEWAWLLHQQALALLHKRTDDYAMFTEMIQEYFG